MEVEESQDQQLGAWMARAQSGDADAYGQLLGASMEIVKRYLLKKGESREVADDVLQETFLSVHQARHTYDPGRSFATWMLCICQHRLSDYWRKRSRVEANETQDEQRAYEVAESSSECLDLSLVPVLEALEGLPRGQREAVKLLKLDGLSVKAAALHLGISESALKVAAHRGYEALKKRLRSEE